MDVTARKQTELQAQQHRDELEQLRQRKTALLEKEVAERARLEREVIEICAHEQRRIAYDLRSSGLPMKQPGRPGSPHAASREPTEI